MPPAFSIIVPTYNRARLLRSALRTIQSQTLADWECFVIDDGSTDETSEIQSTFASDARFHMIRSKQNQGMNASRNLALARAGGRWVTFLDSDDLWMPDRLQAFRDRAQEAHSAGFLFSNAYLLRYDRIVGLLFDPLRNIPEGTVPGHYGVGDQQLPYVTTNVAILREAFERWGYFKTEMRTLDTELFARFLKNGLPVAVLRRPLSVRRIHEDQLTVRYEENFEESLLALSSSQASADVVRLRRTEIARETAMYLIKSGNPREARRFLSEKLENEELPLEIRILSRCPAALLAVFKKMRSAWLRLRYHPWFAPSEFKTVLSAIGPLLRDELAGLGRRKD